MGLYDEMGDWPDYDDDDDLPMSHAESEPNCKGHAVLRQNRKTLEHFWGCSAYPNCRYSEPIAASRRRPVDWEGEAPE